MEYLTTGNMILAILFIMIMFLFVSKSPKDDGLGDDNGHSKPLIHLSETMIESFHSYTPQEQVQIINDLNDGTARVGRTGLGRMDFDISTGRKIK